MSGAAGALSCLSALDPAACQRLGLLGFRSVGQLAAATAAPGTLTTVGELLSLPQHARTALAEALAAVRGPEPKGPARGMGLDLAALERTQAKAPPWLPGPDLWALPVPPSAGLVDAARRSGVRDQGARGTCVAFATCKALEITANDRVALSPQFLYWHMMRASGFPPFDGSFARVSLDVLGEVGVCQEKTMPYDPTDYDGAGLPVQGPEPGRRAGKDARKRRTDPAILFTTIRRYPTVQGGAEATWARWVSWIRDLDPKHFGQPEHAGIRLIQAALSGSLGAGPRAVVGCFAVYKSSFAAAKASGQMTLPFPGEQRAGGHAMTVVGYADDGEWPGGGYLVVQNSWGAQWPMRSDDGPGMFRMPYAYAVGHLWEAGVPLLLGQARKLRIERHQRVERVDRVERGDAPPAIPQAGERPHFCTACGAPRSPTARFCPQCGRQHDCASSPPSPSSPAEDPVAELHRRHQQRVAKLRGRLAGSVGAQRCIYCGEDAVGTCPRSPDGHHRL